jgi:hypothetical protein
VLKFLVTYSGEKTWENSGSRNLKFMPSVRFSGLLIPTYFEVPRLLEFIFCLGECKELSNAWFYATVVEVTLEKRCRMPSAKFDVFCNIEFIVLM